MNCMLLVKFCVIIFYIWFQLRPWHIVYSSQLPVQRDGENHVDLSQGVVVAGAYRRLSLPSSYLVTHTSRLTALSTNKPYRHQQHLPIISQNVSGAVQMANKYGRNARAWFMIRFKLILQIWWQRCPNEVRTKNLSLKG